MLEKARYDMQNHHDMQNHYDVLIAGAGAAGLTLATDLQRRGVSYRLIDAAPHGFEGSRAKGIQPRTAEVFDDLGVLPLLEPRSTLYPPLGIHLGPLTLRRTMIKLHEPTDDIPHPNTLLAPQYATELNPSWGYAFHALVRKNPDYQDPQHRVRQLTGSG